MAPDRDALARLHRNEADPGNRRRVDTILEYLDIRAGDRVLDCGCGLGWTLHVVSEICGVKTHGIDLDAGRLARAAHELGRRATLTRATSAALPFPDGTFDKVILSEVLEHVDDDRATLAEVHRVLRPGGVVAVTVPHARYPFLWDPINWTREAVGLPPIRAGLFGGIWTNHLRLYTPTALRNVIERAGFDVRASRAFVHHCIPFAHNLVYGVGKPLVESGLLASADRFRHDRASGHPLRWAVSLVQAIDRLNPVDTPTDQSSVNLAVKAVKVRG